MPLGMTKGVSSHFAAQYALGVTVIMLLLATFLAPYAVCNEFLRWGNIISQKPANILLIWFKEVPCSHIFNVSKEDLCKDKNLLEHAPREMVAIAPESESPSKRTGSEETSAIILNDGSLLTSAKKWLHKNLGLHRFEELFLFSPFSVR